MDFEVSWQERPAHMPGGIRLQGRAQTHSQPSSGGAGSLLETPKSLVSRFWSSDSL